MKKVVSISMDLEMYEFIKEQAKKNYMSISAIVVKALDEKYKGEKND